MTALVIGTRAMIALFSYRGGLSTEPAADAIRS